MQKINQEQWQRFSEAERMLFARQLAAELLDGFCLQEIITYQMGSQSNNVAIFTYGDAKFVLIPSGRFTLGYDAERPWQPTPEEKESWDETAEEYEIKLTINEYITSATLRPRTVSLGTFLIETSAKEIGWKPVPLDDPLVRQIIDNCFQRSATTGHQWSPSGSNLVVRVRREENGSFSAERADNPTHQSLSKELSRSGFRFPTSDEWEYVCGAGAETLFRWGDHAPCNQDPYDVNPEWDYHRSPNAFGVLIAASQSKRELVAEPNITRGGDGGGASCGGLGTFFTWLTLATAYFETHACEREANKMISVDHTIGRRVFPLL